MRFWGEDDTISKPQRRSSAPASKGRPSVAEGGNVRDYPFLREFYRHQASIGTRVQRVIFFLAVAAVIYAFVLGDGGAVKIASLVRERSQLDAEIADVKKSSELLNAEIDRLKTDKFYIEKIGRERFGYVKPNELVYRIVPNDNHRER